MRYVYFLLINFCSSHSGSSEKVPGTDSVIELPDEYFYIRPNPDGTLSPTMGNILVKILSKMDNRWRPFDEIAPLNVRKFIYQ